MNLHYVICEGKKYLTVSPVEPHNPLAGHILHWTPNINIAYRFEDRADAETFAHCCTAFLEDYQYSVEQYLIVDSLISK